MSSCSLWSGIIGAGVGAVVTTVLQTVIKIIRIPKIEVLPEIKSIEGSFSPDKQPGAALRLGHETAHYYYLTAVNRAAVPAENCFPYVYIITDQEKIRIPGLWLTPTFARVRSKLGAADFEQTIPPRTSVFFCCFAIVNHQLMIYDMDSLTWQTLFKDGNMRFTLVAAVSSSTAKCSNGVRLWLKFNQSEEQVEDITWERRRFKRVPPDEEVARL